MSSPSKRRELDVMKLMMSDYQVNMANNSISELFVKFNGPKDTPYEGGVWKVHVELPLNYPYKSPSIGFVNRIYHPNVDELSGSVCLDVINQSWSPMFDLRNVFDVFLPQLLTYPNPTDPLNGEAAALNIREPEKYSAKVKEYVLKYATNIDFDDHKDEEEEEEDEDDDDDDEKKKDDSDSDEASDLDDDLDDDDDDDEAADMEDE